MPAPNNSARQRQAGLCRLFARNGRLPSSLRQMATLARKTAALTRA